MLAHLCLLQERREIEIYIFKKIYYKQHEWNDLNKDFHLTKKYRHAYDILALTLLPSINV